ncbi:MAG: amidohydrolase, partial [Gammaproteobacteria bacterium]|nr:amidohydrolase [Gammaproteobacteria bacterium]
MKHIRALVFFAIVVLGGCSRPDAQDAAPVADLLLINADVVTVDTALPYAEAVAIKDDLILDVGTSDAMLKHRGEHTEVIDLQGQMVVPGFIEGHGHYTSFGGSLLILDFRYAQSFAEIVSMVA